MAKDYTNDSSLLTDVKTLRARARPQIEDGALTPGYETYKGLGWYGCIETRVAADRMNSEMIVKH